MSQRYSGSGRVVRKKKLRWGRLFLLVALLAILLWCVYGFFSITSYVFFNDDYLSKVVRPVDKQVSDDFLQRQMNVLVLGLDGSDGADDPSNPRRTDTILLVSFDLEQKGVSVLSIPRDTRLQIAGKKGYDKVNHAYVYGGEKLSRQTIANFLNVPIHHSVVLDAKGFMQIVDVLGGVGLYVENEMNYEDPYQGLSIHLKKGYQRLSGEQSIKYIKFRSDELGDIGRVLRQQKFLKAFAAELFSFKAVSKSSYLKDAFTQAILTDMTLPSVVKAGRAFKKYSQDGVVFEVLPGGFATIGGVSYWATDRQEVSAVLKRLGINEIE